MQLVLGHMTVSVDVGVDQPILVAAAGLIVILAILLVFVMVLRSGGQRHVGIGLDAQQGPYGQPRGLPSQPNTMRPASRPAQRSAQATAQGYAGGYASGGWQQAGDSGAASVAQAGGNSGWGSDYQHPAAPWNQPTPAPQPPSVPAWSAGQYGDQPPAAAWQDQGSWGGAQPVPQGAQPQVQSAWGQAEPAGASWAQQTDNGSWSAAAVAPNQQGYAQAYAQAYEAPGQSAPPNGGGWTGGLAQNGGSGDRDSQPYGGDTRAARPLSGPGTGFGSGAALVVRQGKEPGRVYEVRKDRTTIGRSRESDIFLEDLAVSRTHTIIVRDEQGRYILRDENSANGTIVNGQRVEGPVVLQYGDEVQVGQTVMTFSRR